MLHFVTKLLYCNISFIFQIIIQANHQIDILNVTNPIVFSAKKFLQILDLPSYQRNTIVKFQASFYKAKNWTQNKSTQTLQLNFQIKHLFKNSLNTKINISFVANKKKKYIYIHIMYNEIN